MKGIQFASSIRWFGPQRRIAAGAQIRAVCGRLVTLRKFASRFLFLIPASRYCGWASKRSTVAIKASATSGFVKVALAPMTLAASRCPP